MQREICNATLLFHYFFPPRQCFEFVSESRAKQFFLPVSSFFWKNTCITRAVTNTHARPLKAWTVITCLNLSECPTTTSGCLPFVCVCARVTAWLFFQRECFCCHSELTTHSPSRTLCLKFHYWCSSQGPQLVSQFHSVVLIEMFTTQRALNM